ncbi:MAG: GTPase HflX [Deltaproteobacteria bacterium]|nr:GTPase HflX [Deltaproteobacteria bacterium]
MEKVYGKTNGLKASQLKRLQNIYRRKISPHEIISHELARQLSSISREIRRQVGLLATRKGDIVQVVVGDNRRIWIPDLGRYRKGPGRLRGVRVIHTHLNGEGLTREDLTDLVLLGLDLMVCIQVDDKGIPGQISYAHILPEGRHGEGWGIRKVPDIGRLTSDFQELIRSLEDELAKTSESKSLGRELNDRTVLVSVTTGSPWKARESLEELKELALSNELEVVDMVYQHVRKVNPGFLIGRGKLSELVLRCLQTGSNLLIFDNELTPAQVRTLTDRTDLRIIDRSQLILDIFARRAVTREGKIQVELAQLKYLLPRLATKNTAMSRLTGGIGGRGPGETKLEINRRRVRERIARLNRELKKIREQREDRRKLRNSKGLPVISIVGYANAGKSTLLNNLTFSNVGVKDRLFETLDPSSRRLRFPREREAIITDTVGFIRDLPKDLFDAFAATLEELRDADLLLHVVDAGSPRMEEQVKAVNRILETLDLARIPTLLVLNKCDLIGGREASLCAERMGGITISAINPETFSPLIQKIEESIWPRSTSPSISTGYHSWQSPSSRNAGVN